MSIESSSNRYPEFTDTLSLREHVLVRSATVIDERFAYEKHHYGRLFSSEWIDATDGTNFQLEALGERRGPEEIDFTYGLIGYDPNTESTVCDFNYSTYSSKIFKKNEHGKYRRCKQEDIDMLLHCLSTAPTGLPPEANAQFIAMMHANEIRDNRFSVQLKRALAKVILNKGY